MRAGWTSTLALTLLAGVGAAVAAACLPDNPYQRFETLEATIQRRIRWVYERIHFDPKPIDVAILGPSRAGAAVDAARLVLDLAAQGQPLAAVNFALAENGRDLHWVILQELLSAKSPRLIVIGVIEKPGRYGHPAYKYVAPARDVVDPAYPGNLTYLSNLAYLPFRQLRLFAARGMPDVFGLPARFDPGRYAGSEGDRFSFRLGAPVVAAAMTKAELEAMKRRYEKGVRGPLLGPALADVEFGAERAYVARMADLARQRGIRVAFLFLPYYEGPTAVQEREFYERYGPVIDASFLATHPEWYADVAHLNPAGTRVLTDWLAPRVAELAPRGGALESSAR